MGKNETCVSVFSVCLVAVFFLMLYLMSTVNPSPIERLEIANADELSIRGRDNRRIFLGYGNGFVTDTTEFMLDKDDFEEIDFYQPIPPQTYNNIGNGTDIYRYLHRKVIPPLWPRAKQTIIVDPTMHVVMPQDWHISSERTATVNSLYNGYDISKLKPNKHTNTNIIHYIKPMKRRSVDNGRLLNNSGSVILRILSGKSLPIVEIKVISSDSFLEENTSGNRTLPKITSNFTIEVKSNRSHESNKFIKDVIFDNSTDSNELETKPTSNQDDGVSEIKNISNIISLLILVSSKNKNNEEEIMSDQSEINKTNDVPFYENNVSFYEGINNETVNFQNSGASSRNTNDISAINTTKNITDFTTSVKNTSSFNNVTAEHTAPFDSITANSTLFDSITKNNTSFHSIAINSTNIDSIARNSTSLDTVAKYSTPFDSMEKNNFQNSGASSLNTNDISDIDTAKNITDFITSVKNISGFNNVTDFNNTAEHTPPFDNIMENSTSFDSITKNSTSFESIAKNSTSFDSIAGNSTSLDTVAKYSTPFDSMVKNISDVTKTTNSSNSVIVNDYMVIENESKEYDVKYNNNVFMNMFLDDQEINNTMTVTVDNNISTSKNYTTMLNDPVSNNNYTEAFENDSDTVVY